MSEGQRERAATFGELFAVREYRALFISDTVSAVGDMLARIAVTIMVFQQTGSALASGATFAVSYAPYLFGAPILSALVERFPYRRTIIITDLSRMVLFGVIAIPGMPIPAMLVMLFVAAAMNPAEKSARSAQLPQVLDGDRYVLAITTQGTVRQIAQLSGYFIGGALTLANGSIALLIDAVTFGLSALLIWIFVKSRPPGSAGKERRHLLRETADGIRFVFAHRVLRSIALLVFLLVAITIVPEGMAAPWVEELHGSSFKTGVLMGAAPVGAALGALVIGRFIPPSTRLKLIRPVVILAPVMLIPAFFNPPFAVVFVMAVALNFAGGITVALNGLFVRVLPGDFRARAFGVMQTGLMLSQGVGVLATGAIAQRSLSIHTSVAVWGTAGVILVSLLVLTWPSASTIEKSIARAKPPTVVEPVEEVAEPQPEPAPLARPDAAKAEA